MFTLDHSFRNGQRKNSIVSMINEHLLAYSLISQYILLELWGVVKIAINNVLQLNDNDMRPTQWWALTSIK